MQSASASTSAPVGHGVPKSHHFKFTVLKGYFQQSEDETNDKEFDFRKSNFGLINRSYPSDESGDTEESSAKQQWRRFEKYVRKLNDESAENEYIKVLFLGRHGQGWHNVAETKYGTAAWDCYWSMLDGADGITWADANLTGVGEGQARDVHELWSLLLPDGIPSPETFYVSPLTRAIETADLSFKGLELGPGNEYKPIIKELLRETLGIHTCDRRSPATHLKTIFPHLAFEPGFAEDDPLWSAELREPNGARRFRLSQLLDDIFTHDEGVVLSFTSHSGAIGSILEAVGHRKFALETGGVIPVLLRAEKVDGEREEPPKEPSEGPPKCTEPPVGS
ncbi:phosphoglycerate mutase-like protein [Aaosphaeria arxii CBS 175.79]|uniref:Phosphoglycerate mutase-like protein n=1 Tax=Aaosphaeria arxii CBS 175.79 TaxID=1450172 RepID=A0A6A5XD81_9PLEO|nr:phosphoglycerate mutase-like protein [Aaosphaeria arxii CBS 175.79]KAF2010766.1 phosphoglycerate mutase-like protein [Aaosphaeria arxii CBS 175.79]